MKLRLIINADDFGYCEQRNAGILEGFKKEGITSASLMVNAMGTKQAVTMAADTQIPIGLHLNLTEGKPITSGVTLVNDAGYMLGKMGFRQAVRAGAVSADEVREEIRAQIEEFIHLTGHHPVHVDGHQHIHVLPGIRDIFAEALHEYNICLTRLPIEHDLESIESQTVRAFMTEVVQQAKDSVAIFHNHNIRSTDAFVGLKTMGLAMTVEELQTSILQAFHLASSCTSETMKHDGKVTCEVMVHPGYPSIPGSGGCGEGPDVFSCSQDRQHELEILTSQQMLGFYKENCIMLVSFNDLQL